MQLGLAKKIDPKTIGFGADRTCWVWHWPDLTTSRSDSASSLGVLDQQQLLGLVAWSGTRLPRLSSPRSPTHGHICYTHGFKHNT